jgi:nucleoside-diphosphate-sugar epimerase
VNDLAEAMLLMSQKAGSEIFNIGTEKFDTLKNDLQGLIDYANTGSKIVSINPAIAMNLLKILDKFNLSPLADWHYLSYHKDFYFDINKAKTILGWQPTYGNQDMLIESYKWYIENFKNVELQFGTTHRKSVRQKLLKILRDLS